MEIKKQNRDQRAHIRLKAPAVVIIDEYKYTAIDWSVGGFKISEFTQKAQVGDCLPVEFSLSFKGGINISINTLVEVKWLSSNKKEVGFRFLNLTKVEKDLLQYAVSNLQIGEVILLEELSKTSNSSSEAASVNSNQNQGYKTIIKSLNYKFILYGLGGLAIGGILILYTISSLYKSLIRMEIQTAVLSKPIEPIISNNTGILSRIYVREGMKVKAGQPLFQLNDEKIAQSISQDDISNVNALIRTKIESIDELNQKIKLGQLELAEAKVALQNTMALKQQEIDKLQPSKAISQSQLVSARAKVNSLNIQYVAAKNNLNRFLELSQAGAVSQQRADSVKSEFAEVDGALQEAKADLKIAETAVNSLQNGNFYDGDSFISNLPRLTAEVKDMQQRIQLAAEKVTFLEQFREKQQEEVKNLEKQKQQFIVKPKQGLGNSLERSPFSVVYKSPVSGSVLKVAKSPGNKVNDSETIVLLQPELGQPIVEAYLTQDQVTKVSIGSKVTVLVPDLDKSYQAQVVNIDRTGGLPDTVRGQYQLQGSEDKSAYVKLVVQGISPEERSKLTAGMPVKLQIIKSLNGFEGLRFLN